MEDQPHQNQQLWTALSESLENGLSLEVKLNMAKQLVSLATHSFAQDLASLDVATSLSQNPIKTCLLLHEVIGLVKPYFSVLFAPLSEKQDALIYLCGLFLEELENEGHLAKIIHDRDLEGRQVADLIKTHPFLLLKIQNLIHREWQGPLDIFTPLTFSLSTLYTISPSTPDSLFLLRKEYWTRFKEVATPLQFHFFRRSPLLKYMEQFLVIATIATMLTVVGIWIIEAFQIVEVRYNFQPVPQALQEAYDGVFYMRLLILVWWPLGFTYALDDLHDLCYKRASKKQIRLQKCNIILDVGILVSIALLAFSQDYYLLEYREREPLDYFITMFSLNTGETHQSYFAVFGSFIWIRVLNHLRLNSIIGPLLTIFAHMSKVILQFCLLLILLVLTFAFTGRMLFTIPQFSSFYETLITLFSWMLGEFSFATVSEEGWKGEVFMALYLLICMVLMVNLLIALLSTTYSNLASKGVGLYYQSIIEEQPRWAFHPDFNLFTFRVPPLNIITFLSLPCFVKCSSKMRDLIEKIQYLPAYFVALAIVLGVDLLSLPFAWSQVMKRATQSKKCKSVLFALFVFPFIALVMCLTDLFIASVKLWDESSFKAFEATTKSAKSRECVSQEDLSTLKQVLQKEFKDSNHPVPLSTVVRYVREELPFTCGYMDLAQIALSQKDPQALKILQEKQCLMPGLYGQRASFIRLFHPSQARVVPVFKDIPKKNKSVSTSRFDAVKHLLASNSYRGAKGKLFIFPGLLLAALNEIESMAQVRDKQIQGSKRGSKQAAEEDPLKWMLVGKFVRKENEFRNEGSDMTQTAVDYIKAHSHETGLREEMRVRPFQTERKHMRLSTVHAKYSEDSLMMI